MKFEIQKIIRPLDLGEYAQEMKGKTVDVWVNPTRAFLNRLDELRRQSTNWLEKIRLALPKEGADRKHYDKLLKEAEAWHANVFLDGLHGWYAENWSQGVNAENRWSVDELKELDEVEPALYQWMRDRTDQMIVENRTRQKKG